MVTKDYLNEFVGFSMQTMGGSEDVSGIDQGTPTPRPASENYFKAIYSKSRTSKRMAGILHDIASMQDTSSLPPIVCIENPTNSFK